MHTGQDIPRLADIQAIRELSAVYNRAVDDGSVDTFVSIFTDDGRFETVGPSGPIVREGCEALKEVAARPRRQQLHTTTDAVVTMDGDEAKQISALACFKRSQNAGEPPSIGWSLRR
ncbi:nuclear transport factor 2 family protein [Rhodococcus sp. T2V]|uniref:nuclear transport factor 2 family protein n=1 Tax=Rhodococcus sp. T2V TaxID=3034164 RepID=UPI0023E0BB3B|nr:nuclear transport factor 2 family protein [Rhodococcus sp. T2V]MDF3311855.1 nuclear transport factor 2 family protein [Rhodococcus sp. T2V]